MTGPASRFTIGGREPALWVGTIVSLVAAIVGVLLGEGLISDAMAGRITDATDALAKLALLFLPLITAVLIRPSVTSVSQPSLPLGTPVLIKGTGDAPPPDAVVAPVESVAPSPAGSQITPAPPPPG